MVSAISPSSVNVKPPVFSCLPASTSVVVSGSGVGAGTSTGVEELGSIDEPQSVQNFSSEEISEPHSSQNCLAFSVVDTIRA